MTLLDKYLPVYDFAEHHALDIATSPARVMAAVMAYRPEEDAFFRVAIGLRELPNRLMTRLGRPQHVTKPPFTIDNFTMLERRGDNEIAYGLAGKFWRLDYGQAPLKDAESFINYRNPGAAKLILGFVVQARTGNITNLLTETRVQCLDEDALRHFKPYWYLIRAVSGLIHANAEGHSPRSCRLSLNKLATPL